MKGFSQWGRVIFICGIIQLLMDQTTFGQGATATCTFHSKWIKSWWWKYAGSNNLIQTFTNDSQIIVTNQTYTKKFNCLASAFANPGYYYMRQEVGKTEIECVYGYVSTLNDVTYVQRVAPYTASVIHAPACKNDLRTSPSNIMIKAQFDFSGSTCADLFHGHYKLVYSAKSTVNNCDNAPNSFAIIGKREIVFNACTAVGTYNEPYQTTLTCVDFMEASMLQYQQVKGDILILAFKNPANDRWKFYCVKRSYDPQTEKIYLSLYINAEEGIECMKDQNYTTYGQQYIAFELQVNPCLSTPCQNNGTCTQQAVLRKFNCTCLPGFYGSRCETNIDECASNPCLNGATCMDGVNRYTCQCTPAYTGDHCEQELCSLPMEWNATFWGGYTAAGGITLYDYTKIDLKTTTDTPAMQNTMFCLSNHTATDGYTYFTSSIMSNRQVPPSLPVLHCCYENKLIGNFMLIRTFCKSSILRSTQSDQCKGILGNRTETQILIKHPFAFSNGPFLPSATYQFAYSEGGNLNMCSGNAASKVTVSDNTIVIINSCFSGTASYEQPFKGTLEFVGNLPASEFDSAASDSRVMILAKKDTTKRFYCVRYKQVDTRIILSLDVSEPDILWCASDKPYNLVLNTTDEKFISFTLSSMECLRGPQPGGPCLNGGTCNQQFLNYTCTCKPGYTGRNCKKNIDECASNPCQNGGTCEDGVNKFKCDCPANFLGDLCQKQNNCYSSPCKNGGTCEEEPGTYKCTCPPGFEGINCQTNTDDCASKPCQQNGTCHDDINGYNCSCKNGTTGPNCESNIDECLSGPCQNGATCRDRVNGYICDCPKGKKGTHCETTDECYPFPCKNGGTCSDDHLKYICHCQPGFTGTNCEKNIDDCADQPCKKNATCIDGVQNYECKCAAGFTGRQCDIDIDDCVSRPCVYGTCKDHVAGYVCKCPTGYSGNKCQKVSKSKLTTDLITTIILSIFAVVTVAVITVGLIMLHYRRRRRDAKEKYLMGLSSLTAMSQTDSVKTAMSWSPDYFKKGPYNSPNSAL